MTQEGILAVELGVIGLYGAAWAYAGGVLLRSHGSVRMADASRIVGGLAGLFSVALLIWGIVR